MSTSTYEYNFDGLIGPTHNFAGLSTGNIPSEVNKYSISNPRQAALQGIDKMRLMINLGLRQGFIPPQPRPSFGALRERGFSGDEQQVLEKVYKINPQILWECSSASAMWSANAATVSASADADDERLHITPANLFFQSHRAIESQQTAFILKEIFPETRSIAHHPPLPHDSELADEGAANHMRLCADHGSPGVEIFTYGRARDEERLIRKYPARQSFDASRAIALTHRVKETRLIFVRQNPDVIDEGVFHNDLIAVSNENVLLYHERAFVDTKKVILEISNKCDFKMHFIEIRDEQLSILNAVQSFFFNSQIVTLSDGTMALIAAQECDGEVGDSNVKALIDGILSDDNPISTVHYVSLRQSMNNGGGPACLRLRVPLNVREASLVSPGYVLDTQRLTLLERWVRKHYREYLRVDDLRDYDLVKESRVALDELTQMFNLGCIYDFQRN